MRSRFVLLLLVALPALAQTGAPLPPWSRGTLDIHQISTGRGNAALVVFPDGTAMLVDAGSVGDGQTVADTEVRPNASRTGGGWIVQYLQRAGVERLDYAVLTHWHGDHIGQVTPASAASKDGKYKLTGITEVGEAIPIGTLVDRGMAILPPQDDATLQNIRAFIADRNVHEETIRVGANDQIKLRRDAGAFPAFEVRNVAANGVVWTGEGSNARSVFPPLDSLGAEDKPSENMCSIGLRIRYGKFDFFTGGDMPGVPDAGNPDWQSIETAVAKAIGPTDVHVANHHGSIDPESAFFLSALRSTVIILPAWSPTHPSQDSLKRMMTPRLYPGPRDIFVTALREPTKASIGSRVNQLKSQHGHIVVRVAPGGDEYRVFVLDDTTDQANVVAAFGPYQSR